MTTWQEADLSDFISRIESGGRPRGGASEDSGEVPSLGGENIRLSGGIIYDSVKKVPTAFFTGLKKGVLKDQDVLINKDGANTGKVGLYKGEFSIASINEHLFLLRGNPDKLKQRFLYYLLLSPYGQQVIRSKISGSAQPGLKRNFIRDFPVSLPSQLQEQSIIADVIEAVDQAIIQTETLIAKYQRIKTGLMQDLLTRGIDENDNLRDPATHEFKSSPLGRIPADWTIHNLVDVAFIIDPNPSHRYPPALEDGIPLVSTENFQGANGFDLTKSQYVSNLVFEDQNLRCDFQKTDVVFARKGRLGFARPYGEKKKVFSHTVVIIKPRNRKVIADYLLWCLRFRDFFEQIDKRMNSNSGVPTLGIEFLGKVPIRVPHPKEQQKICDVLNNIDQQIEKEYEFLEKTKRTKQGLMQDLLTGKVSVAPLLENNGN